MNSADCYKLLELPETATHKEVKAAQRRLMLQWHPDKAAYDPALHAIALEQAKQINTAADFLIKKSDPPSDYAQQREQERAAEQEKVERERKKAEEVRRQQQQDAEEAKRRRQAADDAQWHEEERQRRDALAEEWQAEWKAEAAQSKEERKNRAEATQRAQQEAEATQRAEQLRQKEAAKREKAVRSRFGWAAFWAVSFIYWYATHPAHPALEATPQQVYDTPRENASANTAPAIPIEQADPNPKWIAVRNDWINGDNGRSVLGYSSTQVHQLMGVPTATLNRPVTPQDDLWFSGTATEPDYHKPSFVSIIYKDGKAVQIENDVTSSDAPKLNSDYSTLGAIMSIHPRLQTATISYSDFLHADMTAIKLSQQDLNAANTSRDEAMHLQEQTEISYYDDVDNGIAFSFKVYTGRFRSAEVTRDTQPDRIIVHVPGTSVIPASYGENEQGKS